ncbi:MAG: DUF1566 domain-containing protein [Myxococcaceae bacterium]|nr:DUF1566 domain-containing protein [Myxococcaceae bacterium]MBH2006829.1 DUF1566 domain-containing protein [Myxococcaceae bacterium]
MIKAIFLMITGLLLSPDVQAQGFVLQNGFSEFLNQQFSNLTQLKNQTDFLQEKLAAQNAMKGLLVLIAPHIEALSDYKKPFSSNCSVFFDSEIDQVACDAQFTDIQKVSDSCRAEQQFPSSYLAQLHKSNILQMQTVVGLDPVQHPQVMYWLYYKLPPTPSPSVSTSQTEAISLETSSASRSMSSSHSNTATAPIVWNPEWANWDMSTGVYRDATNQTGRYNETIPEIVTDVRTGLQWEKYVSADLNWTDAGIYCDTLVKGGFADWRLPTPIELNSLVDYASGTWINLDHFPSFPWNHLWSSMSETNVSAYEQSFYNGYLETSPTNTYWGVRCVRPRAAYQPSERYVDENNKPLSNSSAQLMDLITGLIWERHGSSDLKTWDASGVSGSAQEYCAQLTLGNLSPGTWRLPNVKELLTLMNFSIPADIGLKINTVAFPNTFDCYWTDLISQLPESWLVCFSHTYPALTTNRASSYGVRCVRSPVVTNPEWANWDESMQVYQDATNQTGRYIEARPNVVTDTLTELQWEKETDPNTYNWTEAKARCDNLFKSGFGDWRLPTHVELQSLIDYTINCSNPAINNSSFPDTATSYYWSSDPLVGYPGSAWWASFGNTDNYGGLVCSQGYSGACPSPALGHARCVRPGSTVKPMDRYRDEMGNTLTDGSMQVKDTVTGLIWQRVVSGGYNWTDAQNYCAGLTLGGQTWRLPNVKELSTLLDVSVPFPGPTINATAFPSTTQGVFGSLTPSVCSSTGSWIVYFLYGYIGYHVMSAPDLIRCVRSPVVTNPEWANWDQSTGVYQDATNQIGRYIQNNPSVVTDSLTSLQWQSSISQNTFNWTGAKTYCDSLVQGGYADWRLPTRVELQTLLDYTISATTAIPSINTIPFPNTPADYFWSSTPLLGVPESAWYVSFGGNAYYGGLICSQGSGCIAVASRGYARCVRPSSDFKTINRYKDEIGNELTLNSTQVQDLVTGLIWQRFVNATLNLTTARSYCDTLSLGNQVWRLPIVKELSTLIDVNVGSSNATINTTAFLETPPSLFWSATPFYNNAAISWYVGFDVGAIGNHANTFSHYTRCVRTCDVPPANGVLAAWPASTGAYADSTNQTGRYNVSDEIVTDTLTNTQWQLAASPTNMSFADAQDHCKAQRTGGYRNWRLPNNAELMQLVDYTVNYQGSTPGINSVFSNTPLNDFFSETSLVGSLNNNPWWMSFGQDACFSGFLSNSEFGVCGSDLSAYVRCVRSCYPLPVSKRYVASSGEVTDVTTGLTWQQTATGGAMNRTTAFQHCSQLDLNAHTWRLPTLKELATLVNYSVPYGELMMNSQVFSGEPADFFWSSTLLSGRSAYQWVMGFGQGRDGNDLTSDHYVRCVRTLPSAFLTCAANANTPPTNSLLAAWNASTGVYGDATNQANRYVISNNITYDTLTNILWQQYPSTTTMNFTDTQSYCASQTTGGLTGWRMPNIVELNTMYDYTLSSPYVNTTVFPSTTANNFWSSSQQIGNGGGYTWDLQLGNQETWVNTRGTLGYARCVIACYPISPSGRYVSALGEVEDLVTGLTWQQYTSTITNWTNAANYCLGLTLNRHTWRLPTVRELQTLIDYSAAFNSLMMNLTVFASEPESYDWTSTLRFGGSSYAWIVVANNGALVSDHLIASNSYVRCCRDFRSALPALFSTCATNVTIPPTNGLLAAWNANTDVYGDATNQTNRYVISNNITYDTLTNILWQQYPGTATMNFSEAQAYCASQTTGGLSQWRLPNIVELNTIYDYTLLTPFVNTTVFPNTTGNSFWSSSPEIGRLGYTWDVQLGGQQTWVDMNSTANYVRCVITCYPAPSTNRYMNVSGEVTDFVTGLIWQQYAPQTGNWTWSDSTSYCNGLGLNGHSWRLPKIRELQSLIDYSGTYNTLMMNLTIFAREPANLFWTNTPWSSGSSDAWLMNPVSGSLYHDSVSIKYYVRCCRQTP